MNRRTIDILINRSPIKENQSYRFRTRGGHSTIGRMTGPLNGTNIGAPLVDRTFKGATVEPSA